ncbi:MAG TPA: PLP-dependent aminotransferase family protein [Candidatus Sulfotelmatobacter sp.]|nr:PLP-dependent aminotransferase family protein [Candidatus Sulfotelmatobacter sp.]
MTSWHPDLSRLSGPRYQAIADAIAVSIQQGELEPGAKLPPQRDLAWRLGVTVGTVTRGYMLAEQRGLVSGEVGRGTYVRTAGGGHAPLLDEAESGVTDLSRNVPGIGEPARLFAEALAALGARGGLEALLAYAPAAGHAAHRAAGAAWIGRTGLKVSPEQVVVTAGAQQAIAIVLSALAKPGERVLVEQLTYCGLIDAARLLHLPLEGLPMDGEGVLPEAVDAACRAGGARLLSLVPTNQNPTLATMSQARRQAIVEAARRHDLLIVEDDVYGYLPEDRPPPIATLAPERTIYLASASKCMVPGLRVGWIAAPPALAELFADGVHSHCIAEAALTAQIVSQWIEDGTADHLTRWHREQCRLRQALAAEIFAGFEMCAAPSSFHIFLTLPDPWRAQEFTDAARAKGIVVVPAGTYAVGRVAAPHAVRISLAAASGLATLRQALLTLAALAKAGPGARRAMV